MITEELIKRVKDGEQPIDLTKDMTRGELEMTCEILLLKIVKDEIELDQLIAEVDRNNREIGNLITGKK